jgi:hypothetical protein
MNTYTITTNLIGKTTATITTNNSVEYPYSSKSGLSNTYSVLGLIVSIETLRKRGHTVYETYIKLGYKGHYHNPDGWKEWHTQYKASFDNQVSFLINRNFVEKHSATRLQESHDIGVIAGELHVLTIINKYVELLFNAVDKELITRQINELQSQLATLTTTN